MSGGVTPSLTLCMHLNPPAFPSSPSSASPGTASQPITRPGSGRSSASRPGSAASVGGGGATAVASIQLRPSTVWLSLSFLQRLQTFFEPLTSMPATADCPTR